MRGSIAVNAGHSSLPAAQPALGETTPGGRIRGLQRAGGLKRPSSMVIRHCSTREASDRTDLKCTAAITLNHANVIFRSNVLQVVWAPFLAAICAANS